MAKIMDPVLTILSILGYWAIILSSFGGPGRYTWMFLQIGGVSVGRILFGLGRL